MDLQNIKNILENKIASLAFGESPRELYEPIRYIMTLGGKRMRPLLVFLGHQLFSKDLAMEKVINPAIAVEVFHNFTLMHDDIMDQAPLRRGKATVHKKWNENIAILSGDVMFVKAYELIIQVEDTCLRKTLKAFNQCAAEVCEGQQWDINFETLEYAAEETYIEMIRLKTAVLLGFSLQLGGIIAGTTEQNTQLLKEFGENIGIGFQLKDDLLDVYGDAVKFGKQVGGDIIANKKTFLLIKAIEHAKGTQKETLNYWLKQKEFDKLEKIRAITNIYNQLEIKELTEKKMNDYFNKGFQKLEQIRGIEETGKKQLKNFAEWLINREK